MSHHFTRRQILENLPAYVLGALEPEEMLAVDRCLQENPDPELLARWQELEEATTWLAVAAPLAPLPPSAKEKLMTRVQADLVASPSELQQEQKALQRALKPPIPLSSSTTGKSPHQAPESLLTWLVGWFFGAARPLAWAAVGAFVVALLAGGYISQLQGNLSEARVQIDSFQSQLQEAYAQVDLLENNVGKLEASNQALQQINHSLQQQVEQNQNQLAVLATTQDQVALLGTEEAPASSGTLFFGDEEGLLVLDGLPPLSEEETYQLWLIPAEGDPLSVGLVELFDETTKSQPISLPPNAQEYAAVGLSQEPAGGSPTPTLVVMLGLAN